METQYAVAQYDRNSPDYLDLKVSLTAIGILAYVRIALPGPFPTFTLRDVMDAKSGSNVESAADVQAALDELVAADVIRVIK